MSKVQTANNTTDSRTTFERKMNETNCQVVLTHSTMTTEMANNIGQTSTAYTLNRGVENVGVGEVMQTSNEQTKVIHTVPVMTDTERDAAKKRIGSDLYEIFMRIQAELNLDNEFLKK